MMRKLILVILLILVYGLSFAHEVALHYALVGQEEVVNHYSGETEEYYGFDVNFVTLNWGDNDFSDYGLGIKFTFDKGTDVQKILLTKAWKRFELFQSINLTVGQQSKNFGVFSGSGCG